MESAELQDQVPQKIVLRQYLVFHLRNPVIILVHCKVFHKFSNAFKIQKIITQIIQNSKSLLFSPSYFLNAYIFSKY